MAETHSISIVAPGTPADAPAPQGTEGEATTQVQGTPPVQTTPPAEPAAVRPDWLPAKFKTPQDMASAYAELESKQGQAPGTPGEPAGTAPPVSNGAVPGGTPAEKLATLEGLKPFAQEFIRTGSLTDASYQLLEHTFGISKDVANVHMEGMKAVEARSDEAIFEAAGGRDSYVKMRDWASQTWGKEGIDAYNTVVNGADPAARRLAAQGLVQQYTAAHGSAPEETVRGGGGGVATGAQAYANWQEVTSDMQVIDPNTGKKLYDISETYRQQVEARLANSPNLS